MAGYSQRSLKDKLGIKPEYDLLFVNAPESYFAELGKLSNLIGKSDHYDFIHFFPKDKAEFVAKYESLKSKLRPAGMLWVSWPKAASKIKTDINDNVIRDYALDHGLVDVKVCAVDEVWSALKLIYRLRDRK